MGRLKTHLSALSTSVVVTVMFSFVSFLGLHQLYITSLPCSLQCFSFLFPPLLSVCTSFALVFVFVNLHRLHTCNIDIINVCVCLCLSLPLPFSLSLPPPALFHRSANHSAKQCRTPCALRSTCSECTSGSSSECMWCSNMKQCVDSNAYVASFPFGQCMEWCTMNTCPRKRKKLFLNLTPNPISN